MIKSPVLKNFHREFSLLLLLLAGCSAFGTNSAAVPSVQPGYIVEQIVVLDSKLAGINGSLQVLQDARVTPHLRDILWGHGSLEPDMALSADELRQLGPTPLRKAHLRLIDSSGKMVRDEELEVPLAEINTAFFYGTAFPTYLIDMDYTTGLGSYRGITTRFAEIKEGRLQYIKAVEDKGTEPLALTQSSKSAWRNVSLSQIIGKKIESVSCFPDLNNVKLGDTLPFYVEYSTYRFDGVRWHHVSRRKPRFWENDGPDSWPSQNHFP
jgi:hypothetical protein